MFHGSLKIGQASEHIVVVHNNVTLCQSDQSVFVVGVRFPFPILKCVLKSITWLQSWNGSLISLARKTLSATADDKVPSGREGLAG